MGFITKAIPIVLAALSTVNGARILEAGPHAEAIPNKYIVVMKREVSDEAFNAHTTWLSQSLNSRIMRRAGSSKPMAGMQDKYSLGGIFRAYSGEFDDAMIKDISSHDDVDFIEPDFVVRTTTNGTNLTHQDNVPSWGLARVGSKKPGGTTYYYDPSAGKGVTAYIIDTGIDIDHEDFQGRAKWGENFVDQQNTDCNGHGTHVAGTVGGTKYGLAKGVSLVAVKVLDCDGSGSNSGVIKGMEWAMRQASGGGNGTAKAAGKSVMNMSLGGPRSEASNQAAKAISDAGIFMAVAAGNENMDAQHSSPASEPSVCTVAASTKDDGKADFSNYGAVVDVYAPGKDITSLKPGGSTDTLSGTSMASPHVCGLGAYLIGLGKQGGPGLCDTIKKMANDVIQSPGEGTTGKLIYNGSGK
ncbi:subtilisin-like protease 6 [Trichophyton rubrum D6]|uniref:Subtilisin-like protease 6 n=6 Tax=Trichophyton TaxID=5550 RepID=SUB6_TRIRU|nr:subtilisin-like protease 6 [Trichophyton rubrum CBS 118892]A1XIH1.1 RecName: Full=Subtilisin-like protease 6; Flags: Precursor [Trichophyton soudanense]Q9UW97.1 RecName: Full=Subtilisin-like protease 6; AltName: Allergen=Tri r 2; Flags: Precursor [Trichophyton rubrum]EZF20202.1 subtilisin-like protease 6 [Trichophyton rubrum MR850]EZF40766.1 subtilisin-like protease 6 [Trichophyton rubrum CBS 100081]EZF51383.1 subtilisin-like protease 6 [Trichophyton rubrum CBS 288.86]EZF72657.1 subtilisin